ncbi:isochorismatase [Indivirus ILV1]|uniref:Isochorismatase n=1 Tax=Indivirus ILV1 TaxID=1977633 RepID=A0A1V0SCE8_9VIRU|nr:isochorismatase [Indivirus ILV1]
MNPGMGVILKAYTSRDFITTYFIFVEFYCITKRDIVGIFPRKSSILFVLDEFAQISNNMDVLY